VKLSELESLRNNATKELNTIESVGNIDYANGKLTAINHVLNKAVMLSNNSELDQQEITDLNQFCSDRMVMFLGSSDSLDIGMLNGYLAVKNYILNS
jgi:hypothetical protein